DDDARDRIELQAGPGDGVAARQIERVNDPAEGGAEAAEGVDENLRAGDGEAHEGRGVLVPADRVNRAAEAGLLREDDAEDDDREEDDRGSEERSPAGK